MTSAAQPRNLGRRGFIIGGAAAVAATAAPTPASAAQSSPGTMVDADPRFTLSDPSYRFIRERKLREHTVLQSFAFDHNSGHIYTAQVVQGGRQLPGESATVPGAQRDANGDLCVTKLDYDGNQLGYMYLKGFGHGVCIGVESVARTAYLWTETDADTSGTSARGRRIARFEFVHGAVRQYPSTTLSVYTPVPGSTHNTVSVDPLTRRLLVRHVIGGQTRYALFDIDDVRAGLTTPLANIAQVGVQGTFQGYTFFGNYLYQLEGTSYNSGNLPDGNTYVSCVDLRTGLLVERFLTKAAYTLAVREPEGLAIQLGSPRLFMGFADGASGDRNFSLYYKGLYGE
jgi:hypothetical protein